MTDIPTLLGKREDSDECDHGCPGSCDIPTKRESRTTPKAERDAKKIKNQEDMARWIDTYVHEFKRFKEQKNNPDGCSNTLLGKLAREDESGSCNQEKNDIPTEMEPGLTPIDAMKKRFQGELLEWFDKCLEKEKKPVFCPNDCPRAGKPMSFCATHGGQSLCPLSCEDNAGKSKSYCRNHGGSSLCPLSCEDNAGKSKSYCRNHGGSSLCLPTCSKKYKRSCKKHGNGKAFCAAPCKRAGKYKSDCVDCSKSGFCRIPCPHAGKVKKHCKFGCGGALFCIECKKTIVRKKGLICKTCRCGPKLPAVCTSPCKNANKRKSRCIFGCAGSGSLVCVGCKKNTVQKKGTLCKTCNPSPNHYSPCKEIQMASTLLKWAGDELIQIYSKWGRQNPLAEPMQCGVLRPDFLWELDDQQRDVILEFDENVHRTYPPRCEYSRPLKLALANGRPLHLIRYNPDNLPFVKEMPERRERQALLLSRLQDALMPAVSDDSRFSNIVTVEFLYYYDVPGSEITGPYQQKIAFANVLDYELWADATISQLESSSHRAVSRALEDGKDAVIST